MGTLLLRNAAVVATMDDGIEIPDGSIFIRDGWITDIGKTEDLPEDADEVVDLRDHVVLPGLVNTHHHLYQTLTRAMPGAQDVTLFDWLRTLYPIWARMTPDHVRTATRLGLTELAASGVTTAFDHQYLWPNGSSIDDQFEGADGINIRFIASRGSMSLGESDGGLPPDSVVEDETSILESCRSAVERFHDPERGAMRSVAFAPCSPFSVTPELMRDSADLARELSVRVHTHVAETYDEEDFCVDRFGKRPVEYMESVSWVGPDVWFAHAVHLQDSEVERLGPTGTGVAHCPTSNMRLASGMAPIARLLAAGAPVGLGVDGSASNDTSNMLGEVRQAMLANRLAAAPGSGPGGLMSARLALELATSGGAAVLGRDDIGKIAPGYAADLIAVDLNRLELAGGLSDPVASLVFCSLQRVDHSWVGGRPLVADRQVVGVDEPALISEHNLLAAELVS
jgi:cytosine/adenosine deaminase-related metal-dependent hydrolase